MSCFLRYRSSPGWYGTVDWSVIPFTKKSQVRFPVRAHTQVSDLIPGQGAYYVQAIYASLSLCFPTLPLSKKIKWAYSYVKIKKKDTEPMEDKVSILNESICY